MIKKNDLDNFSIRDFDNPKNHLIAWMPGIFLYETITEDRNEPSRFKRYGLYAIDVAGELFLNAARIGTIYGTWKAMKYMDTLFL